MSSRAGLSKADESSHPLLNDLDDSAGGNGHVIFSLEDDDDDDDDTPLARTYENGSANVGAGKDGAIHDVVEDRAFGLPLRSMTQSREAEFELDPDELDPDDMTPVLHLHGSDATDQRMPLLVGLVDSAHRRSVDLPLRVANGDRAASGDEAMDLEELAAKRKGGGGLMDSIFNMANSILGAGIIGLPYAISQAGLVTGVILLIVLGFLTDWTIRLIVTNAKLSGRSSYIDIMDHCFGKSGRAAVSFFQFSFAFGGMCAFGIIIGDTIPQVIGWLFPSLRTMPVLSLLTNRRFVIAMCAILISYPLSLYRDIAKLSRASALALMGMLLILISVLIESIEIMDTSSLSSLRGSPEARWSIIQPRIAEAIGVISFAFVCHHNSLLIYGSLRTPTMDRFATVTHVATGVSIIACLVMALSGFLVFTDRTQGNILNNFGQNEVLINVARFCFGMNMFTTLPLELFVCREVIENYWFAHEPFSYHRHVLFTTSILMASMFMALITCDLGVTLEITGGVSATALAFIFPAACYYRLLPVEQKWYGRAKLPSVICASFGLVVMTISLVLALGKAWRPEGQAKICM